jgi:hypothetical protein
MAEGNAEAARVAGRKLWDSEVHLRYTEALLIAVMSRLSRGEEANKASIKAGPEGPRPESVENASDT